MGGEGSDSFETYKNLCCRAFLTLRRHAELIINLFSMVGSSCRPSFSCPLRLVVEHCLHQSWISYMVLTALSSSVCNLIPSSCLIPCSLGMRLLTQYCSVVAGPSLSPVPVWKLGTRGRLGNAATVLVMANRTTNPSSWWLYLHLLLSHYLSTRLDRCAQQGSLSSRAWRTRTTSATLWYWTRMNTKQNTCSERWQRNVLTWSGPFKWCGRFIFWGEAERCVLRHISSYLHRYIGLCVSVHNFMWLFTRVFVNCDRLIIICIHKQCYVVINMCFLHVCKCRMFVLLESNTFPFFK